MPAPMRGLIIAAASAVVLAHVAPAFQLLKPTIPLDFDTISQNNHAPSDGSDHDIEIPYVSQNAPQYSDPYEAWANDQIQPSAFWVKSPNTTEAAQVVTFFATYLEQYRNGSSPEFEDCRAHNFGEFNCFAYIYTGNANFGCTIDNPQECRKPGVREILDHVDIHWAKNTLTERVDLARQAFFASEIIHSLLAQDHRFWHLIHHAETYAQSKVPDLVRGFTPQVDGIRVANCELAKKLIDLSIEIAFTMAQAAGGVFLAPVGGLATDALNGLLPDAMQKFGDHMEKIAPALYKMKEGTLKLTKKGQVLGLAMKHLLSIREMGYLDRTLQNLGWTYGELPASGSEEVRGYYSQLGAPKDIGVPQLHLMMSTASGMCGNSFGVIVDNNEQHESGTRQFVLGFTSWMRNRLDEHFRSFFKQSDGTNDSLLAFATHAELTFQDLFDQPLQELERRVELSFNDVIISQMISQTRGFLECEDRDDAEAVCKSHYRKKNPNSNASRYCPKDQNARCQLNRWSKQKKHNHKEFVEGFKQGFAQFNVTAQDISASSWNYYAKTQNNEATMQDILDEMYGPREEHPLLHVPVSLSNVETIEEINEIKKGLAEKRHWRKKFPFCTGGYRCEDTENFMHQVNVDFAAEDNMRKRSLVRYLNEITSPAQQYHLLCRLNVRWPKVFHPVEIWLKLIPNDKDSDCDRFLEASETMTEDEANDALCNNPEWKMLAPDDKIATGKDAAGFGAWHKPAIPGTMNPPVSLRRKCRKWNKAQKKNGNRNH